VCGAFATSARPLRAATLAPARTGQGGCDAFQGCLGPLRGRGGCLQARAPTGRCYHRTFQFNPNHRVLQSAFPRANEVNTICPARNGEYEVDNPLNYLDSKIVLYTANKGSFSNKVRFKLRASRRCSLGNMSGRLAACLSLMPGRNWCGRLTVHTSGADTGASTCAATMCSSGDSWSLTHCAVCRSMAVDARARLLVASRGVPGTRRTCGVKFRGTTVQRCSARARESVLRRSAPARERKDGV
jgi:hypothetical protein